MSARLAFTAILFVTGCGSDGGGASREGHGDAESARVERCTERILGRVESAARADARSYIERTYCAPFEEQGWVYDDGRLRIDAHVWISNSGSEACVSAGTRTVPCSGERGRQVLDCAILHHVSRREVEEYLEELSQGREAKCDDGTPLDELGAS